MTPPSIQTLGLRLEQRGHTVLRDLDLKLGAGEILGLVGPPGAGKTALLRVLSTLTAPSSGQVSIAGFDVVRERDAARRALGYVASGALAYPRLSVQEYLEFFARVAQNTDPSAVELGLELAQLTSGARRPVHALDAAAQQRLQVARALLSDPQVLLLDETSPALDTPARTALHELLVDLADLGKTVVLAARNGQELALVCTQLGTLQAGGLVLQRASLRPGGLPTQLDLFRGQDAGTEPRYGQRSQLRVRIWPIDDAAALSALLLADPAIDSVELGDPVLIRHRGGERFIAELVRKLATAGFDVVGVEQRRHSEHEDSRDA
jgi:ABC-2 type transport system ATP-binding protein